MKIKKPKNKIVYAKNIESTHTTKHKKDCVQPQNITYNIQIIVMPSDENVNSKLLDSICNNIVATYEINENGDV